MVWLKYLMIFGALQGVVLSLALLTIKSPKSRVINRLFSVLVVSISIYLFTSSQTTYFSLYPKLFLLSYLFVFFYTPLFHLFLSALTQEDFKLQKRHLAHAIPALTYFIFLVPYLLMPQAEISQIIVQSGFKDLAITDFVALCFNFFFIYKSWKLLGKARLQLLKSQLNPLQIFWGVITVSNLLWVFLLFPQIGIPLQVDFLNFGTVWTVTSFLIFFFTYFVIIKSEFFVLHQTKSSYDKIKLEDDIIDDIKSRVIDIMQEKKPYLNPDFSLSDLSELSGIDKVKLSMTINRNMETNFFNLVNQYRVREFIHLVNSNRFENFSLLGVAYESGFKSKSTFYKAFKEAKGKSPKEFLKREVA